MVDLPGTRFGRYTVTRTLGTGAFSTVYEAVDEQLETAVALKVLAENHALDADIRERFLREAQLLRRIQCPNVIDVYDVGESDRRQPYLVMAYASGGDLEQRITQLDTTHGGPALGTGRDLTNPHYTPTPSETLRVASALAAGLGRAHAVGLVHRDVKPPNLLLVTDQPQRQDIDAAVGLVAEHERIVLADLGLAKDLQASSGLTIGAGTTGFGAPEQLTPASTVTAAVDIYASSAVIFWLYTRHPPANDQDLWGQLPDSLAPALRRGLANNPDDRQPTIDSWHNDITTALEHPGHPDKPKATARRSRRLFTSLTALLLAAALGASVTYATLANDTPVAVTENLGDGLQRTTVNGGDAQLTVTGPATITAREEVTLEGTATTGNEITWFVPSGETSTGPTLTLTARRPGTATVTAVTGEENQPALVATFELEVHD